MNGTKIYGELTPCGGGDPIPMLRRKLIVGRRSSCDVTLRFPNVSSRHCELELINGYWYVKDLGSSNGIRVNSERCDQKWVFPGDILHIGRHKFEVGYEAAGERPVDDENPFARSLLEKAGLAGNRRQTSEPDPEPEPAPVPKPPTPSRRKTDSTDDDLAMEWLKDH
ncbi:MAG: FHA domain-containing protein [Planctomycetota bacterium]|nr:FHA domain-containing protein [Planctomycetota bacterium]MDA1249494.1 FHA domain-containing protein [Planctomycetota bacterium]